jgi:hypothetical protein
MRHSLTKLVHDNNENPISEKEISVEQIGKECQIRLFDENKALQINLTKEELSEFIGLMLHVQSQIKRNIAEERYNRGF